MLRLQEPWGATGLGRVEVLYNGQWGTICDDGWHMNNARVVCRQLGYHDVIRTLRGNQVPSGYGPIWLSHLDCTGNEKNITGCSHWGWGNHDCKHHENVGVECKTTGKATVVNIIRLLCACKENCVFCFHESRNVSQDEVENTMEKINNMHPRNYSTSRTKFYPAISINN